MLAHKIYVTVKEGIFKNSNHFAYALCMAVVITAILSIYEKRIWKKVFYLISFTANTYILILNNTFGGYLGVLVALLFLYIYLITNLIIKLIKEKCKTHHDGTCSKIIFAVACLAIFAILSFTMKDDNNNGIVTGNIKVLNNDVETISNYTSMIAEKENTAVAVNNEERVKTEEAVKHTGSGRGATWSKIGYLVKQKPIFGYGLECLRFQFLGQFDISEGRTHNIVFQMLGTVGIPGAIIYFSALGIIFIRLLKKCNRWNEVELICTFTGISYMVTALTGNSTYYTSPYFALILGLAFMISEKTVKRPKIS